MGYLNNAGWLSRRFTGQPFHRHGNYALLTPDGLVKNIIPGFTNCDVTILSTPKLSATFVDYLVTLHEMAVIRAVSAAKGLRPSCM
jgi:(S)-ureidoglycine aminohydrolase